MPEQNEMYCERCGEFWPWNGEDRDNVCASCQADAADAYADYCQERDYLDSRENGEAA